MNKLAVAALVIVAAVAVQGSLFGPFGPFGPFGQAGAAAPAFGQPAYGPPAGFFPGSFGPSSAFGPARFASRALLPAGSVGRPYPKALNDLLLNPALPADLREQANQLVAQYEQGNADCDVTYVPFGPTASSGRFCKVLNRVTVELAAKELEREATARAELAAQAAAAAAAEEAAAVVTGEAEAVEEPAVEGAEESVVAEEPVVEVEEVAAAANVEEETV